MRTADERSVEKDKMELKQTKWRMEPVQEENKTMLYIYDDVSEYGDFDWETWSEKESETSAKFFAKKLGEVAEGQTIELHINSNGGSVKEGTAIYNLLKQKNTKKVGIVDGVAHSVAFLILQACDERKMCLGTTALIHNMWLYCEGNAAQLRKYADDLDDMMEANRQIFMERATISEEELISLMEKETYLTPEKALEYGLIDEIMKDQRKEADVEAEAKEAVRQLADMRRQMNSQQSFREQIKLMKEAAGKEGEASKETESKDTEEHTTNNILNLFKGGR